MNERKQRENARAAAARSAVRVSAAFAAIGGAVLMTEGGATLFTIGFVLFASAIVAARIPSLFWVPRPARAGGERDEPQVLAAEAQQPPR